MIKLVVGLGNPGLQYQKTRHNAGFLFLDALQLRFGGGAWQLNRSFQGEVSECYVDGARVLLIKPQTYMNLSGVAVERVVTFYKLKPEEVLVVHDELELASGVVRIKRGGGHAGHNGLRDIIAKIGSADFYRLRFGVGRPQVGGVADYVLSRYSPEEVIERDRVFLLVLDRFKDVIAGDLSVAF